MKRFTLLLLCCGWTIVCLAQDIEILKPDEFYKPETINLPFKEIIVKDARFDKTKIGCINNKVVIGFHSFKKKAANFPDSLHRYLPELIKGFTALDPSKEETLFILIKKFRVAENYVTSVQETINDYLTLNLSASFYSVKDGRYTKLFSIDNLQSEFVDMDADVKISFQHIKTQRSAIINKMIYKLLAFKSWKTSGQPPSFSDAEVTAALQKRFELPLYQRRPPPGLYKSFSEFKNASPSVSGITITYDNGRVKDVLDERGTKVSLKEYWGLSNGQKSFLIFREEATELIPCDKSFRILSYRTVAELTGRAVPGDGKYSGFMGSFSGGKKVDEYFDLDMDTGALFLEEVSGTSKLKNIQVGTN